VAVNALLLPALPFAHRGLWLSPILSSLLNRFDCGSVAALSRHPPIKPDAIGVVTDMALAHKIGAFDP